MTMITLCAKTVQQIVSLVIVMDSVVHVLLQLIYLQIIRHVDNVTQENLVMIAMDIVRLVFRPAYRAVQLHNVTSVALDMFYMMCNV